MRIAVIGAGAIGGYFGARLADAGEDVHFVARGETLRVLAERGLRVESPLGDLTLSDVQVTGDPASIGEVDVVIVGVKAWQVPGVAPTIAPLIGPETCVLPLQNGVEASDQLAAAVGAGHVLGAVCKIISRLEARGHVQHLGAEPTLTLGELDNRRTARLERLCAALERARVKIEIPADVRAAIWEKFLLITSVSGLGAVTRSPLGVLRALPETRAMLEQAMNEVMDVAAARGVTMRPDIVERTMEFFDGLPEDATASMQRDIMEGRPSELEDQNGAVVRLGRERGVATPLNHFVYHCLLPMERAARANPPPG